MYAEASTFERLTTNRIRFVTFNFDTLIEHRLASAAAASYPETSYAQARAYLDSLVTHVHGTLEAPPEGEIGRFNAQKWIAIVPQAQDDKMLATVRAEIESAEMVCFLGFGYHEANVKKLGFPMNGAGSRAPMYGTAKSLGSGERPEILRLFGNLHRLDLGGGDEDCLRFLKSHHILRG